MRSGCTWLCGGKGGDSHPPSVGGKAVRDFCLFEGEAHLLLPRDCQEEMLCVAGDGGAGITQVSVSLKRLTQSESEFLGVKVGEMSEVG